jgi:hypothetical protein
MVLDSQAWQRAQTTEFAQVKILVNPLQNMTKFTAEQIKINADFTESLLKFKTETS